MQQFKIMPDGSLVGTFGRPGVYTVPAAEDADRVTIGWTTVDHALRGTGADPQAYANRHNLIIIEDEDAAAAGSGSCWWAVFAGVGRDRAVADYVQAGGTASTVYVPR